MEKQCQFVHLRMILCQLLVPAHIQKILREVLVVLKVQWLKIILKQVTVSECVDDIDLLIHLTLPCGQPTPWRT